MNIRRIINTVLSTVQDILLPLPNNGRGLGGWVFVFLLIVSCTEMPTNVQKVNEIPDIYPDYIGVTIPADIAPLDFNYAKGEVECMDVKVRGSKGGEISSNGDFADFDIDEWHALTEQNRGGKLTFTVCVKQEGAWKQYKDFDVNVSQHDLGEWGLTYRLIPPGYEVGGNIGIYQRDLHSFDEEPIMAESAVPGQCMNCHTANRTDPSRFYQQIRGSNGGTLIQRDGKQQYLTTKTDSTRMNTSYGYWHPGGDYIAFSTNSIHQSFFVGKDRRIEVFDTESNVLVLDSRTNELVLSPLLQTDDWETYPVFSAEGKTIFYCTSKPCRMPAEYDKAKYSMCTISFDAKTGKFGTEVDTLLNAASLDKSFTYPRPSYDGRWLMYNVTDFGNFPVNHKEADLWLMDLKTGTSRPMNEINSDDTECFHNWTSNSRWFVFGSRRENGMYTQLFLSSIDDKGKATKPFLLPQRNPLQYYHERFNSYNCPDFTRVPVDLDIRKSHKLVFAGKNTQVKIR